jgi:HTH-type transcriptional regulator/antitoxin HigA
MEFNPLKSKKEYLKVLARFEEIFQTKPGSHESDEADGLAFLIKEYKDKHFIINAPSPIEAIK